MGFQQNLPARQAALLGWQDRIFADQQLQQTFLRPNYGVGLSGPVVQSSSAHPAPNPYHSGLQQGNSSAAGSPGQAWNMPGPSHGRQNNSSEEINESRSIKVTRF